MKEDPIYMEKRALEFLRAWPGVPEVLRPVYSRFYDVGLIWVDPNVDYDPGFGPDVWPGALRLTEGGAALKDLVDGQSFNFFTVKQIMAILPSGDLTEKERRIFKDDLPQPMLTKPPPKVYDFKKALDKWKYQHAMLSFRLGQYMSKVHGDDSLLDAEIPF